MFRSLRYLFLPPDLPLESRLESWKREFQNICQSQLFGSNPCKSWMKEKSTIIFLVKSIWDDLFAWKCLISPWAQTLGLSWATWEDAFSLPLLNPTGQLVIFSFSLNYSSSASTIRSTWMFTLCHLFVNLQLFSHLHLHLVHKVNLLHLPYPLGPPEYPSYFLLHEALSTFLHLISILIVHLTQSWLISTRTCVSTRPRQNFTTSQQDEVTSTCAFRNKHHHTILL